MIRLILTSIILFIWGVGISQCACIYYNEDDEYTCVLYESCAQDNLNDCAGLATSSSIALCEAGTLCPQSPDMGNNCGGCQTNGACWYQGNNCNPETACAEIAAIITLPITLINFSVENFNDENKIEWNTSSEQNNQYFILSYSSDGLNFNDLVILPGAGNSTNTQNYNVSHRDPKKTINYYKLTQVDFDGQSETFGPISIDNRKQKRTLIKKVNLYGQEVDQTYKGIVIYLYDDGTTEKIHQ